jgi:DNA-binding NtrC family response regulator
VRDAAERRYILEICSHTGFNLRRTARILEISPKSLYAKLKAYAIARP